MLIRVWRLLNGRDGLGVVGDGLVEGHLSFCLAARVKPMLGRLGQIARFREVMGRHLWLLLGGLRELTDQGLGDLAVQLAAPAFQQAFVCRVLDQRVLERVNRVRHVAAAIDQSGGLQLFQPGLKRDVGHEARRRKKAIVERPASDGANLSDLAGITQPVKPFGQNALQRRRDHRLVQLRARVPRLDQALGQLLHEKWHAVGAGDNLVQ